jgi:hypothetical protein
LTLPLALDSANVVAIWWSTNASSTAFVTGKTSADAPSVALSDGKAHGTTAVFTYRELEWLFAKG